ncbi:MAG: hypothetical protein JO043_08140 [Candidatus Eremiobacteraeota bacterium]|nr:hypothetical protein [Candidatus Eremiobacteraeota bacterium]
MKALRAVVLFAICLAAVATASDATSRAARHGRHDLIVKSVWAVRARKYCNHAVVKSIEAALRAFQHTRITNTTKCLPQDREAYLSMTTGCGKNGTAEIIELASPVEFNDLFWKGPRGDGLIYELIVTPRVVYIEDRFPHTYLEIGLGRLYPSSYTHGPPKVLFMGVQSREGFLHLGQGECRPAAPPSLVPTTI